MEAPPSFEEIKRLIASRKPPTFARVTEHRDGAIVRRATVVHDGLNGWYVDDGERVELRAAEDRVTFVERGTVERFGPGMVASSNNWVKFAIDGRRTAYLDRATGEVLGSSMSLGRSCWVVRAYGLKSGDAVFVLHVDAETGIALHTIREDRDSRLDVEELIIGTVTEPNDSRGGEPT